MGDRRRPLGSRLALIFFALIRHRQFRSCLVYLFLAFCGFFFCCLADTNVVDSKWRLLMGSTVLYSLGLQRHFCLLTPWAKRYLLSGEEGGAYLSVQHDIFRPPGPDYPHTSAPRRAHLSIFFLHPQQGCLKQVDVVRVGSWWETRCSQPTCFCLTSTHPSLAASCGPHTHRVQDLQLAPLRAFCSFFNSASLKLLRAK